MRGGAVSYGACCTTFFCRNRLPLVVFDRGRLGMLESHVREYRIKAGLSQERLARELGVNRQSVINIERSENEPRRTLRYRPHPGSSGSMSPRCSSSSTHIVDQGSRLGAAGGQASSELRRRTLSLQWLAPSSASSSAPWSATRHGESGRRTKPLGCEPRSTIAGGSNRSSRRATPAETPTFRPRSRRTNRLSAFRTPSPDEVCFRAGGQAPSTGGSYPV
jgi:hypothetical protein